jgi:hypothetical protein
MKKIMNRKILGKINEKKLSFRKINHICKSLPQWTKKKKNSIKFKNESKARSMVVEHLLGECKALSSNPSTSQKKRKKK